MPALKNPRHEAFAQAAARGMSASAAYVEAGYKANRHNATTVVREQQSYSLSGFARQNGIAIHFGMACKQQGETSDL